MKLEMKTVILMGDSIRRGYQDTVQRELIEVAHVRWPEENCLDSRNILAHVDEWALSPKPDIIHLNCGLHDLKKRLGQAQNEVPIDEYEKNVRQILHLLKSQTQATVIWATTTPVNESQEYREIKKFARFETEVTSYNAAAVRISKELDVPINDLFIVGEAAMRASLMKADGVHFLPEGCVKLGKAVAQFIQSHL